MTDKINKSDLINDMHERLSQDDKSITKKSIALVFDALFDSLSDALKNGKTVALTGMITVSASDKEATTAKNPQTGATVQVPARKQVKFKVGQTLKDRVNDKSNK